MKKLGKKAYVQNTLEAYANSCNCSCSILSCAAVGDTNVAQNSGYYQTRG